jgi:hypothetical protein
VNFIHCKNSYVPMECESTNCYEYKHLSICLLIILTENILLVQEANVNLIFVMCMKHMTF